MRMWEEFCTDWWAGHWSDLRQGVFILMLDSMTRRTGCQRVSRSNGKQGGGSEGWAECRTSVTAHYQPHATAP